MFAAPTRPLAPAPTLPTVRRRVLHHVLLVVLVLSQLLQAAPPAAAARTVATPTIVPFEQWAPAACPRPTGADRSAVQRAVVHHTHVPTAPRRKDVPRALARICELHVKRGFATVGYHYIVDPWGTIYQGRGALPGRRGRAPRGQAKGAHVGGTNAGAVGVVFIGDHEAEPPRAAALDAATRLLAWVLEPTGRGPSDHTQVVSTGLGTARYEGVVELPVLAGHSRSNHTACPGAHLKALLPPLHKRVARLLAGKEINGWAGLAADQPAKPATPKAPAKQKAKAKAEPARTGTPAKQVDASGSARGQAAELGPDGRPAGTPRSQVASSRRPPATPAHGPLAGPLASPAELLARGLREAGLESLADRLSSIALAP